MHSISQGYNYKKRYGTNPFVLKLVYTRHIGEVRIWLKYTRYIPGIYYAYTEKFLIFQLYTKNIYGIYHMVYPLYILEYTLFIHSICSVYTLHILGIYVVYIRDIQCILGIYIVYTLYIMRINYTRWLVLWRRAGSHSTGSTCNHIAWTSHNFYFAPLLHTLGVLALVDVDAQGAPWTVNRRKVPCLTGKTYELIFLSLRHSRLRRGPNDKDNQSNCYKEWRLEQGIKCHTRNIPGIYQVYSRYLPNAGPWTSCRIRLQSWPRRFL